MRRSQQRRKPGALRRVKVFNVLPKERQRRIFDAELTRSEISVRQPASQHLRVAVALLQLTSCEDTLELPSQGAIWLNLRHNHR